MTHRRSRREDLDLPDGSGGTTRFHAVGSPEKYPGSNDTGANGRLKVGADTFDTPRTYKRRLSTDTFRWYDQAGGRRGRCGEDNPVVRREPYRGGGQPVFIDTTSQRYRAYRLQELTDRGVPIERAVQLLLLREKYQETSRDLGGLPAGSKPPLGALLPRLPQPEAKPSALNASLVATAPGLGGDSFAIIEDGVDGTQKRYRLGDKFQDRTLASVGWNRVVLRSGDHDEFLQLLARPEGRELLPLLGVVAGAPRTPRAAIQPNSEFEFAIDRAEVDRSTEHTNELFTQIRAVPHFQDGQAAGFRVFAIRPGSVFDRIGLKNGDIITAINGSDLTDPAGAMLLITALKDASRVSVDVVRNRVPVRIRYEIH